MPNGNIHRLTGVVAACATPLLLDKEDDFSFTEFSSFAIAGYSLGTLPDLFEPAIHPNHRKFFHSLIVLSLMCFCIFKLHEKLEEIRTENPQYHLSKFIIMLILVILVVYIVHLVLDGFTKKGLPLL